MSIQRLAVLGATGSIGESTWKIVRQHPERFDVVGASANQNMVALAQLCCEFDIPILVVPDEARRHQLLECLAQLRSKKRPEIWHGAVALTQLAESVDVDTVVAAIVGAAGLPSTLAAASSGKRLLLANKESLVVGGHLVTEAAQRSGALILPLDSEHNALFQCLPSARPIAPSHGVVKLWLTASGGPFRQFSLTQLQSVTAEQACAHPIWQMGRKISVDSATLMNKGLEVIEAFWLFGLPGTAIDVVVHPQSVVHSMVEYRDGSFLAQLGSPDMCTPIAYGLAYPERIESGVQRLNPLLLSQLTFEAPDHARFPCLKMAFKALEAGPSATVVLNAANEIAVECFLNGTLGFTEIGPLINECLQRTPIQSLHNLDDVLGLDKLTRDLARTLAQRQT